MQAGLEQIDKVLHSAPKSVKVINLEFNKSLYIKFKTFCQAILAKANAFYGLGLFEKSMTQHYRGLKINPMFNNCAFSKGIRY